LQVKKSMARGKYSKVKRGGGHKFSERPEAGKEGESDAWVLG
jgi:hypothetical protein